MRASRLTSFFLASHIEGKVGINVSIVRNDVCKSHLVHDLVFIDKSRVSRMIKPGEKLVQASMHDWDWHVPDYPVRIPSNWCKLNVRSIGGC